MTKYSVTDNGINLVQVRKLKYLANWITEDGRRNIHKEQHKSPISIDGNSVNNLLYAQFS